ncbi:MAG TPA: hypothetical protein VEK08_01565 [Planctomycetota bacterium]|nr:hypothetical protein [Planctomycetota bacterium]
MVLKRMLVLALLLLLSAPVLSAADKDLAAALASGAAKLAADNKPEKAKEMCFKALANDENCAEALFELGKLYEKEGNNIAAAEFLVRASREFAKEEAAKPAFGAKRAEAEGRIRRLNPYATKYAALMTDYAQELGTITRKSTDAFTMEEAGDRVASLNLADIVAPDKLPQISKPAPPKTPEKTTARRPSDDDDMPARLRPRREAPLNVPVDVEKALKAAGWEKFTGSWKKVKDNVYEVTDGKLETAKTNGAVQVIAQKGSGTVRVLVRNGHNNSSISSFYTYGSGYGFSFEGASAKMFTPYNWSGTIYRPWMEREVPVSGDKCMLLITVMDGNLEMMVNGKREHKSNYKINKEGPFVIEVEGTMTIEAPMAKGQ